MELIASINSAINGVVWGPPMLILLVGCGILLTIRTAGVQFRKFGYAMKNTLGKIFKKTEAAEGEVTPFQAVTTALAATVGTGNIAGITAAVTLGGPGSIFWLWVTALIGMCTKYSEVLLAIKYREKNEYGDWVGGPMYYIKNGLGKNWKWLGAIFCIFGALAAFGIGNAVQVGNITSSVNTVITAFNPDFAGQSTVNLILGIILAVVFGGANAYLGLRIGTTISASIPAAVLSMGVMRIILKRDSILENNMAQTIGSAGESLAAGAIFTIPALFMWASEGLTAMPSVIDISLIAICGGVLGVMMIPPTHALICRALRRFPDTSKLPVTVP